MKKAKKTVSVSKDRLERYHKDIDIIKKEIKKVFVGQEYIVNGLLRGILANGHVLIEGLPGLAKTLVTRSIASVSGCRFSRIQFTVDLLPTDITGITAYDQRKGFYTVKGPIFANFVVADEINRAPPKTQSALLEAMQEKQVTIGRDTFTLEEPFFVIANNNPIESSGVYTLPESQLDRFLFKLKIGYPTEEEEQLILKQNMTLQKFEDFNLKPIMSPKRLIEMQQFVKSIHLNEEIEKYIIKLVNATRNPSNYSIKHGKYIEYGVSPRASIGLYIASKAEALLSGNAYVTPQHVKNVAPDVLRHRILLNYEGQAEGIKTEDIIKEILSRVPVP